MAAAGAFPPVEPAGLLPAGEAADVETLSSELRFLLAEKGVPLEVQARLARAGVRTVSHLSLFEDSRGEARRAFTTLLGAEAAQRPETKLQVIQLLDAWETASKRKEAADKLDAEARSTGLPRTVQKTELIQLRLAFERLLYPLTDDTTPGVGYMESKFEQIDDGEIKAENLKEVTSLEDDDTDRLGAVLDKAGVLRIKRASQEVRAPANPEALRTRLKVVAHMYTMARLKHTNRAWLASASPQIFLDHVDYMLGPHVYGLAARDHSDKVVATPSWATVLSYEFQVRKRAMKFVNEQQLSLAVALKQAREDPVTKERFFVTPIAIAGPFSAPPPPTNERRNRSRSPRRPAAKAAGKGQPNSRRKGRGKGAKALTNNLPYRTPDGRQICFKYNSPQGCKGQCSMVHVCRRCFQNHTLMVCTAGAPQDTPQA